MAEDKYQDFGEQVQNTLEKGDKKKKARRKTGSEKSGVKAYKKNPRKTIVDNGTKEEDLALIKDQEFISVAKDTGNLVENRDNDEEKARHWEDIEVAMKRIDYVLNEIQLMLVDPAVSADIKERLREISKEDNGNLHKRYAEREATQKFEAELQENFLDKKSKFLELKKEHELEKTKKEESNSKMEKKDISIDELKKLYGETGETYVKKTDQENRIIILKYSKSGDETWVEFGLTTGKEKKPSVIKITLIEFENLIASYEKEDFFHPDLVEKPEAIEPEIIPEENPVILNKELEQIKERLDLTRREYIIKNNELNKKSSFFKEVLGFGRNNKLGKFGDELEEARDEYKNALTEYKDFVLNNMPAKESVELMTNFFNKKEYLNIAMMRDQISMENVSWPEKVKKGYLSFVDSYRKLPIKHKILMGTALAGIGFGFGMVAGTAGAVTAMSARKLFSMSVGSVGYLKIFQGMTEKKLAKQADEESQDIISKTENKDGNVNVELLNALLDKKINEIDEEIQKRDLATKRRVCKAVIAGVVTSFAGSWVGHQLIESGGVKVSIEFLKSKLGHIFEATMINDDMATISTSNEMPSNMPSDVVSEKTIPSGTSSISEGMTESQQFDYQGGKSVWQEAQKQISIRLKEQFENLGADNPKAMEALQTYNIDRLKDAMIAHPSQYGLPKDIDFTKMSAKQIAGIHWDKAFHDTFDTKGVTEKLSEAQVNNIVENNESLREAARTRIEEAAQKTSAVSASQLHAGAGVTPTDVENPASGRVTETQISGGSSQSHIMEPENVATQAVKQAVESGSDVPGVTDFEDASLYDDFIDQSRDSFEDVLDKSDTIFDQHPDFKSINDIGVEITKLENLRAGGADVSAEKIQALSMLKQLRQSLQEVYMKTWTSMFDSNVEIDQKILDMPAKDYIEQHKGDKAVKIFKNLKLKLAGGNFDPNELNPKVGESTAEWTKRMTRAILSKFEKN